MRAARNPDNAARLPLAVAGPATPFDVNFHEPLRHELHHLAQHVYVGTLLGEFGQCDS